MLLELDTPYKTNILINFLIEPYMLKVYYTTFLAKKYKWYEKITTKNIENIQQEALKFLNVLQRYSKNIEKKKLNKLLYLPLLTVFFAIYNYTI